MIYRHEVQLSGPKITTGLLMDHRIDPNVDALEEIPKLFSHWTNADWSHAVHLKESGIFYVITNDPRSSFLTIWYEK